MKLTRAEEALINRKRHQAKVRKIKSVAEKPARDFHKADRGRVIDKPYRAWIRRLPCVAGLVKGGCSGPIEAAHVRFSDFAAGRQNPGLQRKSDDNLWLTPLCRHHHQGDQHQRNERGFWSDLAIDVNALCRELRAAYEAAAEGLPVLKKHVQRRAA